MRALFRWASLSALLISPLVQAAGSVEVQFVQADKFTDAGRGSFDTQHTLKVLGDHLKALGRQLPDGQTLQIDVSDIDLAGELRPARAGSDLRVLRGRADWPQITLRYSLLADGKALKAGEDRLVDLNYMWMSAGLRSNEEFPYERRMLTRWFGETFKLVTAAKN